MLARWAIEALEVTVPKSASPECVGLLELQGLVLEDASREVILRKMRGDALDSVIAAFAAWRTSGQSLTSAQFMRSRDTSTSKVFGLKSRSSHERVDAPPGHEGVGLSPQPFALRNGAATSVSPLCMSTTGPVLIEHDDLGLLLQLLGGRHAVIVAMRAPDFERPTLARAGGVLGSGPRRPT